MTVRMTPLALAAVLAHLAVPTTSALHFCDDPPDLEIAGLFYVVVDTILEHGYLFSAWVYCESNGIPGLQRGGVTLLGDADVCQNSAMPDTCIF